MNKCPYCHSENIYFSKKNRIFVCEDCDKTFTEETIDLSNENDHSGSGLDIFFSYGHDQNKPLVERIKHDLEVRGHHVWIDSEKILTGDNWRNNILEGVLNSASVIAFLSEYSTRKPGVCLDELKIAVCVKGANIKTVLLEPEYKITPPSTLSDVQWLDMSDWKEKKNDPDSDFERWYNEKFTELCRVLESKETLELSGDIHSLRTKLMPYLNTEKEYALLSKEFYGRHWLEDHINHWKDTSDSNALVVYGKPGSGKSAFSVNFAHYNPDVYGCFLCEWNRGYTTEPKKFIKTMAFKLATKMPDYRRLLIHQLEDNSEFDEMSDQALFEYLLKFPLSHLVDGNRDTGIVIIDGLDEAEVNGDNPLAKVLSNCIEGLPKWIKFVFTCRPEKSVKIYFDKYDSIDIVNDMPQGYDDIKSYLVKALSAELQNIPNKLEILENISKSSEGVFLYAEYIVQDIKSGIVKINDSAPLPTGLNAFYMQSMERKFKTEEDFKRIKPFLELLTMEDVIPEFLLRNASGYTQYTYLVQLDTLGSWVLRYKTEDGSWLGFSHKSLKDWFSDANNSGRFYVDFTLGALNAARFCKKTIDDDFKHISSEKIEEHMKKFVKEHVCFYYALSGHYDELESFLLSHSETLDPYWKTWNAFPASWNHDALVEAFWNSPGRVPFMKVLQREGSSIFALWIFDKLTKKYQVKQFDNDLILIYTDMVHLCGEYLRSVQLIEEYLEGRTNEIGGNDFLAFLSVRKLHHSMFFVPAQKLLSDGMSLLTQVDERTPFAYCELLHCIGANLALLVGDRKFAKEWISKTQKIADEFGFNDMCKRNDRKLAECYLMDDDIRKAEQTILKHISPKERISGRYEAYLMVELGNVYTCLDKDDEALQCYQSGLQYLSDKGIYGWVGHANLGIANVNYKIGNVREAIDFATRANNIYNRIHQEWGKIMSDAMLSACDSKIGTAPLHIACLDAIEHARRMDYDSCVSSIQEVCSGEFNYFRYSFL